MKSILNYLTLFVFLFLTTAVVNAQTDSLPVLKNLSNPYISFTTLVLAVPIITEFLKKVLGKTRHTPNIIVQALSWIVSIILTSAGWFFNLGFLENTTFLMSLLYGLAGGLVANGIADTKIIQTFLLLFKKKS